MRFPLAGTDLVLSGEMLGVRELGQKLKSAWKRPEPKSLEDVEAAQVAALLEVIA